MGKEVMPDVRSDAHALDETAASLVIAVPFYRNERLVGRFIRSLIDCAAEIRSLNARVVLFNDSPDYPALGAALGKAVADIGEAFPVSLRTNAVNLGWLKTCNIAMQEAVDAGADILLFNSDTVVFPGAIAEMKRVAAIDAMIAFVNPRSNNATLASLPHGKRFVEMQPAEAEAAYRRIVGTLPELTYVPTAVGFAVLIKRKVLAEFGLFDEVYGGGYNEENDLVMRASRCGYRAALANRAYVWHEGEQSLGTSESSKAKFEDKNRAILVKRYPEYMNLVTQWFQGVEHTTEQLLSALVPEPDGRLRVAFDMSSFGPFHSGTFKVGVQLIKQAAERWTDRFDIVAIAEPHVFKFHGLDRVDVERCGVHGQEKFAAVFRVGQPFDWDAVRRLTLKGATIGVSVLDTIALDCSHLQSPFVFNLWQHLIRTSDFIVSNSNFTAQQFSTRFAHLADTRHAVSLHSLDPDDYLPGPSAGEVSEGVARLEPGYVLVIGNQYPHKAVGDVANRLAAARPDMRVVALGVDKKTSKVAGAPPGMREGLGPKDDKLDDLPNLEGFRVGGLSDADIDALHRKASVMIMPSHYEGFGMPIPMALAYRKPILVRDMPVLRELHAAVGGNPNVHFFETTADLVSTMKSPPAWVEAPGYPTLKGDSRRVADDIRALIEKAIEEANYPRILDRFRAIHTLYGAASSMGGRRRNPSNPAEFIAQRAADSVEYVVKSLLSFRPVYVGARWVYRRARKLVGR